MVAVALFFLWPRTQQLPGPKTSTYQEYLRAFNVGVAALEAGREEIAEQNLSKAVELIPGEPAAWANLGLLNLRRNKLDQAAHDLHKANQLRPANGEIEALLGLLAEKQGRLPDAVVHLRQATLKDAHDLASLYSLAEVISKEGNAGSEVEYQRLMEQILKVQPSNLPVLLKRAGAAFRRGDKAAYRATLDRLNQLKTDWAPLSKKTLDELSKADGANEVTLQLQILDNVLKAEPSYARDLFIIRPRPGWVGIPLRDFLILTKAPSTPAVPDRDLTFTVENISDLQQAKSDVISPMWVMSAQQRATLVEGGNQGGANIRPEEGFRPAVLLADARSVRRADGAGPQLIFPSGPKNIPPTSAGVLVVDWDNDFRPDLFLAGGGGLRFWQQRADGSFTDVTANTDLPARVLQDDYYGAWAADIEMDGDLDIIVARSTGPPLLLRNNGDGTFKAIEIFTGVSDLRTFLWADLDNDGAPDAILLDGTGKLHVFANDRSGQFSRWQLPDNLGTFLGATVADTNADGVLDIVALRSDSTLLRISDQNKRERWQITPLAHWPGDKNLAPGSVAIFAQDLDNNGAVDIVIAGPREAHIYLGGAGEAYAAGEPIAIPMRVMAVLDLNGDGRLDFLGLSSGGRPLRALNRGKKNYRWQALRPLANPKAGDNRINSFAIGGEAEVRSGALVQKQPIVAPVVHFGLGEHSAADLVRIVWPNGVPQWEFDLPTDRVITAAQRLTGSCPFLYTFDGSDVRFAGDFMWGTPLGMYVNGQNLGSFPQTTEWLKIPGAHLVPKDGLYDLRVQANLWEADYFDKLALLVLDHPPDTEVYVDERFFLVPTLPMLHLTTPAKPVSKAWDHEGKEVTDLVSAIDGRYLDHCGRGRFQGVTRDHWVEIDLGDDAPREGPVLLVARGWLHPTNSSINVALPRQAPRSPTPRPRSFRWPRRVESGTSRFGLPRGQRQNDVDTP